MHQLFTKTIQFNLPTIRYSLGDVEQFHRRDDAELLLVHARDRFGELGQIGLALVLYEGEQVRLDSFILSCRAMGRGIESALMNRIKERARERAPEARLVGTYRPTAKNVPIAAFLAEQGFALQAEQDDGSTDYALAVAEALPVDCSWIEVELS